MAKDYAKRVLTTKLPAKKRVRVEFIILSVFSIMCCLGYWFYAHKTTLLSAENTFFPRIKAFISYKTKETMKSTTLAKEKQNQESSVHFDFYNTLPSMQMITAEKPVNQTQPQKPHDPEAPSYIIQLGMFKDSTEASQLRLSLLLSGFEANIVKIKLAEGSVYRVQNGPYLSQTDAKKYQLQMQQKGIQGVVKKL